MSNEIRKISSLDDTINDTISNTENVQDGGYPLLSLNNILTPISSAASPYYIPVNPSNTMSPDLLSATSPFSPTNPIRIPGSPQLGIPVYSDSISSFSMLSPSSNYMPNRNIFNTIQINNLLDYANTLKKTKPNYNPISMNTLNHSGVDNVILTNFGKSTGNHSFTGAGVILFERNKNPDQHCVILFESNGSYQDLGGSISPDDYRSGLPVSTAAKREAMEETATYLEVRMNLNRVVNNTNIFAEIHVNKPSYRCYAIGLEENAFNFGSYIGNLQKLNLNPYTPPHLIETTQARRFYLKDIEKCLTNSSFQCNDTNGQIQNIRERTVLCLKEMVKNGKNSIANIVVNYISRAQEYKRADGFSKLVIYD
jgi:hypothetical protein